jgi:transposase-like protein/rubredoxin
MAKSYQICCPKCNNHQNFYRYGKDKYGNQKYLCRVCGYQFAPDNPATGKLGRPHIRSYPTCPVCGKAMFLHHDHKYYSNYQCCDKKCGHSIFVPKPAAISAPSMSKLSGKTDFKRMRYPVHVILTALSMFYMGKNSFRNIALILRAVMNIRVSHTTISNWCTKFAPLFQNISLQLIPTLNFNSDEWHADETVVKIRGVKYYLWLIVDSETRFVLGFHLSRHRDSPQAFSLLNSVKHLGKPGAVVTDRYSAYEVPVKAVLGVRHIRVQSFRDDITNNLIECFNKQFKAWYKTKQGFASFDSANNLISLFLFFYNFVRPHSALDGLTPAQVAGLQLPPKSKYRLLLVA